MAHNVSQDEELLGIFSDIENNRFHQGRQVNPGSMLYRTVKYADDAGYLKNAQIDDPSHSLATIDLSAATLTESGNQKLQELRENNAQAES
ncbi:hypothetical protein AYR62_00720 [Secundilactobacillus paracollinoides]|uniref:Uncharacterized protein n=1 Tax=Secundilactobacillus paracollinoides TaxID=240427 RepID=A0A1B2IVN1_9LACO|nr:hypothetical protein [Secundilactobacillus paracollinoides]ANZ62764.1 hypothetical protein AYR62_00720 [Secundilactobacillus paracollinoides]ANZ66078.1 hypothetical protein AYR63_02225 [Secundilactobacillus paracollinoides]